MSEQLVPESFAGVAWHGGQLEGRIGQRAVTRTADPPFTIPVYGFLMWFGRSSNLVPHSWKRSLLSYWYPPDNNRANAR